MALSAKQLIADVKLRLSSSKVTSDFPISDLQIMFWLRQARDKVTTLYLETAFQKGNHVPSELLETIASGSTTDVSSAEGVKALRVALTDAPLTVFGEKQIIQAMIINATAYTQTKIRIVDFQEIDGIREMEFTKPTTDNPVGYVKNGYFYLENGTTATTTISVLGIREYASESVVISDFTAVPVTVSDIIEEAVITGMKELRPELYDTINDGKQE
jgi:hypothetical protein